MTTPPGRRVLSRASTARAVRGEILRAEVMMGGMGWFTRVGALFTAVTVAVLLPAAAWAAAAGEVARPRPRIGGLGLLGTFCCLAVVAVVVVAVLLLAQNRRRRR